MGDGANGPGLTAGIMVSEPPPCSYRSGASRAHEDRVLEWPSQARTPQGSGAATCGSQTPLGLSIWTGLGDPDLSFPREGVRCRDMPLQAAKEAAAGSALPRARGRRPSAGHQPNYRIKYG
jgi:hypothetical protein